MFIGCDPLFWTWRVVDEPVPGAMTKSWETGEVVRLLPDSAAAETVDGCKTKQANSKTALTSTRLNDILMLTFSIY
jgi:hypothetical protein